MRTITVGLALALLAGCDNNGRAGAFGTPPPGPAPGISLDTSLEFRGQRACVDCLGIEALLTLEERAGKRRYRLVEDYVATDRERRFEDAGEWQSAGELLRLTSSTGGERVYRVLPDNRLQAVDAKGRALPALADDILVPTAYSSER